MTIAWDQFTPISALIGGLLIGLASAIYILGNGRIAGIAGIVGSVLQSLSLGQSLRPHAVRLVFILGLLIAPWVWQLFAPLPEARIDVGTGALVLAGLLVGMGVRMGNGCTSGHGVCGLSRLSLRSLANVLAFMAAGFVTVFVIRHVIG
jgi:uncharacterized membrane protein YedE/YeeE